MSIIADLHLHSKYSRAVSQKMDLFEIGSWAAKKGINLVATGDWTHPLWLREIKTKLKESSLGIFSLAEEENKETKFLLSTEISSIYVQKGKQRRIHNLILSPSIEICEKIVKELQKQGANLLSDGRPIIGLSSEELLELLLSIDKNILLIPCHVWTPWFSLYGSKSGFDSVEECFGEYSKYIYAIETGLSSDPIMNWQIKELENRLIVSFSDAHSGIKLGREATVFIENSKYQTPNTKSISKQSSNSSNYQLPITNYSYFDIVGAIKQDQNSKLKIGYTIEFFPEEGKYHWSGHRLCNIRYSPAEIRNKGTICPVCQRPLTIGVENRVVDLAEKILKDNDLLLIKNSAGVTFVYDRQKKRRPFVSLVPLFEILLEVYHNSQTNALREYERLIVNLGPEFDILLKKSYQEVAEVGGEKLAEGIKIVRERKVFVDPGYDGVFGKVRVFDSQQLKDEKNNQAAENNNQQSLF